jgi:hypothetical protein
MVTGFTSLVVGIMLSCPLDHNYGGEGEDDLIFLPGWISSEESNKEDGYFDNLLA